MIAVLGVTLPNGSASPHSRLPSCPASARSSDGGRTHDARAGVASGNYSAWQATAPAAAARNGSLWRADGTGAGEAGGESQRATPMASVTAKAAAVAAADAGDEEGRASGGSRRRRDPAEGRGEAGVEGEESEGFPPRKAARGPVKPTLQAQDGTTAVIAHSDPKQPPVQMRRRASSLDDGSLRNPMEPCGACTEWLRKVAEVNPDFKVVTFTDSSLDQVFVKPVQL